MNKARRKTLQEIMDQLIEIRDNLEAVKDEERKNYYGVFEMTDPVALQPEKVGLLKGGR